jgi:hypothetical protein
MRATIAVMLAATAALAACTTRVIERQAAGPSVVTTPAISERTVVERPAPAAAAGASTAPQSCTYASQSYSNGALACQDKVEFRCNSGSWERTANTLAC